MARIGIIVDNPKRDLSGCVLLANKLLQLNHTPILIPMYYQGTDIPLLNLDIVVVNYFRFSNLEYLEHYKKLGIKIVVMDTEGGVLAETGANAPENIAKRAKSLNADQYIDLYAFWGEKLKNAFANHSEILPQKLIVTGPPRYDFCVHPLSSVFKKESDSYILINTNFPLVNPAFAPNADKEQKELLNHGWKEEEVLNVTKGIAQARDNFVATIKKLLKDFPEKKFILRPHPFESETFYHDIFKNYSNFQVDSMGEVFEKIYNAEALLHLNCSTAVEATFMKTVPISVKYAIPSSMDHIAKITRDISYQVENYDELREALTHIENVKFNFDTQFQNYLAPYFFAEDGQSSLRLATAIDKLSQSASSYDASHISHLTALLSCRNNRSITKKAWDIFKYIIGSYYSCKLKNWHSSTHKNKVLKLDEVKTKWQQISGKNCKVSWAKHPLTHAPLSSILID